MVLPTTLKRKPAITNIKTTLVSQLLVAIGIFKHRHEVLIAILAKQRRRRLAIQNTREDFDRLTAILSDYGLPVWIGFEVSN